MSPCVSFCSVRVCVFVSVSVCVCVYVCVCVCAMSVCVCICVSVCFFLRVSICVCEPCTLDVSVASALQQGFSVVCVPAGARGFLGSIRAVGRAFFVLLLDSQALGSRRPCSHPQASRSPDNPEGAGWGGVGHASREKTSTARRKPNCSMGPWSSGTCSGGMVLRSPSGTPLLVGSLLRILVKETGCHSCVRVSLRSCISCRPSGDARAYGS